MQNKLLTILTPSYNRGIFLRKLYLSLCSQTSFNFDWVIVDDGSNDNTESIVSELVSEKFEIKYLKKENGGKHSALNYGIKTIMTCLTFIVDSDDLLTNDAIESIESAYFKYKNSESLGGLCFQRMYPDGSINTSIKKENGFIGSYNSIRIGENIVGDMAEIYFTDILKLYPFPIFEGEKFLSEEVAWVEIGKKFNLCFINKPIYISEYLTDGLTQNRRKNSIVSSNGSFYCAKTLLSIKLPFIRKIKTIMQLIIYGSLSKKTFSEILKSSQNSFLFILLYLPSILMKNKWEKQYL